MSREFGGKPLQGKAQHDCLAIVHCDTDYCGTDSYDIVIFSKGDDIESVTNEMAYNNYTSFGLDEEDEESGVEGTYYANTYRYQLTVSGNYIGGGEPRKEIVDKLTDLEAIGITNDQALIYVRRLCEVCDVPPVGHAGHTEEIMHLINMLHSLGFNTVELA